MANVKKIKLPSNTTYNISDYRIPDLTASDAGKILKINSTGDAFEIVGEAVTSVNGETGAVSLSIPSTASDVGAIAAPSSASSGQFLKYNGTTWIADNVPGGASPSDTTPSESTETGSAGTSSAYSRGDHSHPKEVRYIEYNGSASLTEIKDWWDAGKAVFVNCNFTSTVGDISLPCVNCTSSLAKFSTSWNGVEYWAEFDDVEWDGGEIELLADTKTSFYGTSSTAASTTAKTTSITGYSLRTGNIISIEFTNANTANAPTLNISSTGAKAIWYKGAVTSASNKLLWLEGEIVTFIYTGSYYEAISINTLAADVDLFPVTYNSDTFQEIHDAYDKGKYIYCINGDRYFALQSITSTQAKFVCVDMASNYQIITYTVSSSGWSVTNQYPVLSVNGISATNTSYGAISVPVGYANSTNSTSKLFLVGATTQATEPNTYSNSHVYATNGVLNATSFSVNASANIVYNSSAKSIDFTFN